MNQVGQTATPSSLYEVLEHLRDRQATQSARFYYYPTLLTVVVECSSILQSKRGSGTVREGELLSLVGNCAPLESSPGDNLHAGFRSVLHLALGRPLMLHGRGVGARCRLSVLHSPSESWAPASFDWGHHSPATCQGRWECLYGEQALRQ